MSHDENLKLHSGLLFCWLSAATCLGCGLVDSNEQHTSATGGGPGIGSDAGQADSGPGDAGAGITLVAPTDDRPIGPTWKPSIPLGTSGWQQSALSYCDTHRGAQGGNPGVDVWADSRGIFALANNFCVPTVESSGECDKIGMGLQYNDGNGWKTIFGNIYPGARLSGFPGGPVVLNNFSMNPDVWPPASSFTFFGGASVSAYDGSVQATTLSAGLADKNVLSIRTFFGLGPDHAYLLVAENTLTLTGAVLEYRGGTLSNLGPLPFRAQALWANSSTIAVSGFDQSIYVRRNTTEFVPLAGVPAGGYTSIWGFSATDLWAGNTAGQLVHYDGQAWQVVPTGSANSIADLWGMNGVLYFGTASEFGRWNGSAVEILIPATAGLVVDRFWGRSENEVFLAVRDNTFAQFKCGEKFLVWFDGSVFHQF